MDNIILQLITRLDSSKTADDVKKIQEQLNAKGITLKPVLDTATSKKEIQNLAKQLQSIMSSIDPKFGEIGVKEYTSAINATIAATKKAATEQEKSNKAMDAAFEKTERMRQAEEKRQQTAQNNAINKNLEAEYKEREKLANLMADGRESARVNALQVEAKAIDDLNVKMEKQASTYRELRSSGKTEFSFEKANNGFAELEKMGLATKKLKSDMAELNRLYRAIDPSNSQTLVSTYSAFDTQLKKVNNSLGAQKLGLSEVKNQVSQIDKITFANQIQAWRRVNSAAEKDFGGTLDGLLVKLREIDNKSDFSNLQKQFRGVKAEADALGVTGKSIGDTFASSARKFSEWVLSAGAVMTVVQSVKQMISNVIKLDTAMTNLYKVTDETDSKYNQFLVKANKNAQELGRSVSSLVEQTATWAKLGFTIDESADLAKVSSIYANVGEVDDKTAVSDLVTAIKAFNIEASDSITIVDSLNELGNRFATDSASLGEGLKNSASSLKLAGNDINQTLAMLTGGTEIIQNAGEMGNALKILSMRIRGMKGELEALGEEYDNVESISKIQTQILNRTGGTVNIFDNNGNFKSTYEILKEISEVWDKISQTDQANNICLYVQKCA